MSIDYALHQDAARPDKHAPRSTRARAARRRLSVIGPAQLGVASAIAVGWALREDRWFVPNEGFGYAFGILGLGMMTLLLLYPIRKRLRSLRDWGRLASWFEVHMLLGLVGPLAILYHANFRLGSLNANIALACMLSVAGSGVMGRVIYVRIHESLSGRRKTLASLREALETIRSRLVAESGGASVLDELARLERTVLGEHAEAAPGPAAMLTLPWRWRITRRRAFKLLNAERHERGKAATKSARNAIRRYLRAVRGVAVFSLYERLFALWHIAHLPLCFLLYASAAIHVVAVHMY